MSDLVSFEISLLQLFYKHVHPAYAADVAFLQICNAVLPFLKDCIDQTAGIS